MSNEPKPRPIPLWTPHLKARCERHGIKLPPFLPMYDRVFVYPLKEADSEEIAKTTTGPDGKEVKIYRPSVNNQRLNAQRGILVAAGLKAFEYLHSYGAQLGDYVVTMRLSPWERSYLDSDNTERSVLILYASDITANEDLVRRYEKGELFPMMSPDGKAYLDTPDDGSRMLLDPPETDHGV